MCRAKKDCHLGAQTDSVGITACIWCAGLQCALAEQRLHKACPCSRCKVMPGASSLWSCQCGHKRGRHTLASKRTGLGDPQPAKCLSAVWSKAGLNKTLHLMQTGKGQVMHSCSLCIPCSSAGRHIPSALFSSCSSAGKRPAVEGGRVIVLELHTQQQEHRTLTMECMDPALLKKGKKGKKDFGTCDSSIQMATQAD